MSDHLETRSPADAACDARSGTKYLTSNENRCHPVIAASILVLGSAAFCTQAVLADTGGQQAASSGYRLRMCEIPDCSVPLASEPYEWITQDGRVLNSGVTDARGYAAVSRVVGVTNYALENVNARWDMRVEDQCWSRDLNECAKLISTVQHDDFDDAPRNLPASQRDQSHKLDVPTGPMDRLWDFTCVMGELISAALFSNPLILIFWIVTVCIIYRSRLGRLAKVFLSLALLIQFGVLGLVLLGIQGFSHRIG